MDIVNVLKCATEYVSHYKMLPCHWNNERDFFVVLKFVKIDFDVRINSVWDDLGRRMWRGTSKFMRKWDLFTATFYDSIRRVHKLKSLFKSNNFFYDSINHIFCRKLFSHMKYFSITSQILLRSCFPVPASSCHVHSFRRIRCWKPVETVAQVQHLSPSRSWGDFEVDLFEIYFASNWL